MRDGYFCPADLREALEARAVSPDALAVAGATDVLVDVNAGRIRPTSILDLSRTRELDGIWREAGRVRIGAGATYRSLIEQLAEVLPSLVTAARSVGSPPIRNRGTIGGNLATASPAGDCHPPLLACGADIRMESSGGSRTVPVADFFAGPKRSVLRADELITEVSVPIVDGPQAFAKVGYRNAMVIAVCSLAVALRPGESTVGTGIGSAGPVPLRATAAEEFLAGHLGSAGLWESRAALTDSVLDRFGELVADAARPIDDLRGSASYRQHALRVLARRTLAWCWEDYRQRHREAGR